MIKEIPETKELPKQKSKVSKKAEKEPLPASIEVSEEKEEEIELVMKKREKEIILEKQIIIDDVKYLKISNEIVITGVALICFLLFCIIVLITWQYYKHIHKKRILQEVHQAVEDKSPEELPAQDNNENMNDDLTGVNSHTID